MALARWEPLREIARLQDDFNRFFDNRAWRWRSANEEELSAHFVPAVDIYEDNDKLALSVELPGMAAKDVDVRIENGVLTIKGERKIEKEDKKENYIRVERTYGTFTRSFNLPNTVDSEKVKADFKDGLLEVSIPKKEETKPRTIQIKVS